MLQRISRPAALLLLSALLLFSPSAHALRFARPAFTGGQTVALRVAPAAFTGAQTDTVVVSVPTGSYIELDGYAFTLSKDTTVNVSFLLECDESTDVRIAAHGGVAPGSGVFDSKPSAEGGIVQCADGDDLLLTISAPTNGAADIAVNYQMLTTGA